MEAPFSDFGSMVFGEKEMADRLPNPVYQCWKNTVAKTGTLDRPTADAIAFAMCEVRRPTENQYSARGRGRSA